MRSPRDSALIASVAAAVALGATQAAAQTQPRFPTKPVRIVVGFSAGSATDITARMIGPKLSEMWGQPVIVENRAGAGSVIASQVVAKAAPDGYTLLIVSSAFAIGAVLNVPPPYDPLKDFAGVANIGATAGLLAVSPSLGVKSVKELIAVARERPGKLFYGSAGIGSGIHMTAERFRMVAGIEAVHVPYKGQPEMLIDMVAGRIHFGFPSIGTAMAFVKDGRLLALAMVTAKRSPQLPNVPVMTEVLPGFERDASHALIAPAGTPLGIRQQISRDVARVMELPDVKQQMYAMSFEALPSTPEEYDRILRGLLDTFAKVVKAAGLRSQ
jgi:tripartite-type tricarboxylate transporter receptor subunit TctC